VETVTDRARDVVSESIAQAREQLHSAWKLHVARVEEELRSGWEQHLDYLLQERFGELAGALEAELREKIEGEARARERRWSEKLNQLTRRMRHAERQEDWAGALVEAAGEFSTRAALFVLQNGNARMEKSSVSGETLEFALSEARAFASAAETLDPVVAAAREGEISAGALAAMGAPGEGLVYLFPIVSRGRAVGVLYGDGARAAVDTNGLEMLATLAGLVWEARAGNETAGSGLVSIQGASPGKAVARWAELPAAEQELHLKAQRFARVQVAEMRLYRSEEVKRGRAERTLYKELREEIDRGRESYRIQYVENCPSMADYFHVELVRTIANDDAGLLGADYPGPLV
jgi:hypothetical protein